MKGCPLNAGAVPDMLHAAAPNACGSVRKHLYLAYGPRWMRPSGYNNHSPELLVRTHTIRFNK